MIHEIARAHRRDNMLVRTIKAGGTCTARRRSKAARASADPHQYGFDLQSLRRPNTISLIMFGQASASIQMSIELGHGRLATATVGRK